MRYFYLFCLSLFSMASFGSHLLGGEITWKCVGPNQYIFQLDLYNECFWAGYNNVNIQGPNGSIGLTRQSVIDMTAPCIGTSTITCTFTTGLGSGKRHRYITTTPVTLNGTIPPSGWVFSYTDPAIGGGVVNTKNTYRSFYIQSVMYPYQGGGCNSSPQFDSNPILAITSENQSISAFAQPGQSDDSLYYHFYQPMVSANVPDTFATGYSATSPFPSNLSHTQNGPVVIHTNSGLINLDIHTATTGLYAYGVEVEQWRDNQLTAVVWRNVQGFLKLNPSANNSPSVSIDTSQFNAVERIGDVYRIYTFPGDTIYFETQANDSNLNSSNNQYQVIDFGGRGFALDSAQWGGRSNFMNKAVLNPVSPQTGFSNQLSNTVAFNWNIAQEHLNGNGMPYVFHLRFSDDECSFTAITNIVVEVYVKELAEIAADTLRMCEGDSVQLNGNTFSGNFNWSPGSSITSTNASAPLVYPTASRYYYLNDPQNPNFKDSVFIDVTPTGFFNLAFNSGQLLLTDSVQTTTRVWFYNGIPFAYPYDTLTPFGLGDYYAIGKAGACEFLSDTVAIDTGMSFAVSSTGNGAYSGSPVLFTGSLGTTVQVSQSVYITSVAIAGVSDLYGKTGGYDLKLQVYDNMQNQVFLRDTTLTKPMEGLVILPVNNLKLKANTDYTFSVSGDTGYAFSVFENVSLPATPHNAGLTVKAISEGSHGQFPSGSTNYMLPLTMGINQGIGIGEVYPETVDIFPNPASSAFTISGFAGANTIELLDVNGKIIRSFLVKKNQEKLKIEKDGLPAGLYFVKAYSGNTTAVKKVLFQ